MDNIIKTLEKKDWHSIKKYIIEKQIEWDYLVDPINGMIHYLAYHNQSKLIKIIDTDTIDKIITQPNLEGNTVCHIAAKLGNTDLLQYIIQLNVETIYLKNNLGCTPLYYVITNKELIINIVKKFNIVDHYINDEHTLISYYILSKDISTVIILLDIIKHNKIINNSLFAIIYSTNTEKNKIKLLKLFIKKGFNINILDKHFISPLIYTIRYDLLQVAKFLIKAGANINYSGPENIYNPLILAIINNNNELIKLLLEYSVDINIRDKYMKTPVHYLFMFPNNISDENKITMLESTRNLNSVDDRMDSILNLLIHNDQWKKYINILQNKKLKIYLKNKDNIKPLHGIDDDDLPQFLNLVYHSYINYIKRNIDSVWVDRIDNKIGSLVRDNLDISSYQSYVMGKIASGKSYPMKKNKLAMLKFIVPPKTNISHFSAYTYNYICFLLYILKKYPEIKIPSMPQEITNNINITDLYDELIQDYKEKNADNAIFRSIIKDYLNHSSNLINHLIIWKDNQNYFFSPYIVQGIHECITKYPNVKYILLKLTIISDKNFNHANILLYNIDEKYVERFDPYGVVPFFGGENIDLLLESFFKDYFPGVEYLSPKKTSGDISFQIFSDENNKQNYIENDPNGFCIAWCIWYIESRIKNINIKPNILIKKMVYQINKHEDKFKDYIRNYANYLDIEKNNILNEAGIPKKYWYSMNIPTEIYKAYLSYIRKIYKNLT